MDPEVPIPSVLTPPLDATAPLDTTADPTPDRGWPPSARRRAVFVVVSAALFMASIDQTIVATALPTLQHDLHTQLDWGGWTITAYALGQLLTMPVAGKVSEQYGRKRVFLGAVALFTLASLCCGLAGNIYELVALRALQSIGGGAFMPAATGIVTDLWGAGRDKALGLFTSIFPIGGIVGPVLGGVFVDYWSWRGIFLVNVPIGIALVIGGAVLIPSHLPHRTERFDIRGVALMGLTLLSGMLGITFLGDARHEPSDPRFIGPIVLSVTAAALFVRHSRRAPAPFIPLRLLTGPVFGVMNIINVVFGSAAAGFSALVPVYAQDRLHISPLSSSTMLVARSIGMVLASILAVSLLRRTGVRRPMVIGYIVIATGLLLMPLSGPVLTSYAWIATGATFTGIGIGISAPSSNNAALQLAPDNAAAIAGLRGMFRQIGGITAVSVSTAVAARSGDPATTLSWSFATFAVIVLLVLPLIRHVPEHRGSW